MRIQCTDFICRPATRSEGRRVRAEGARATGSGRPLAAPSDLRLVDHQKDERSQLPKVHRSVAEESNQPNDDKINGHYVIQ